MKIISSFPSDDHRRLDGLFNQFQRLLAQEAASAGETFSRFMGGLERHIEWEEELLFPQFEQRSGMTGVGPTAVMRSEHRCFKILIDRMQDRLSAGASPDGLDTQLLDALTVHNRREEKVLYAWMDGLLSEEEAGMLINGMKDMPDDGRRLADSI
jgi:iron-sulfur cluster repair protein YtfE (RIC family)